MTVIHSNNVLLEDIYVNSTDVNQDVNFGFSSLNVGLTLLFPFFFFSSLRFDQKEDNTINYHCR